MADSLTTNSQNRQSTELGNIPRVHSPGLRQQHGDGRMAHKGGMRKCKQPKKL